MATNRDITFIVRMRNQAKSAINEVKRGLREIARQAQATNRAMAGGRGTGAATSQYQQVAAGIRAMGEQARRQGVSMRQLAAQQQAAAQAAQRYNTAISQLGRQAAQSGRSFREIAAQQRAAAASATQATRATEGLTKTKRRNRKATASSASAMEKFKEELRNTGRAIAVIDGPLSGLSGRFTLLAQFIGTAGAKIAAFGVAATGAALLMKRAVTAGIAYEKQMAQLEAQLEATGYAAGFTAEELDEMARKVGRDTLASAQGVRRAQSVLLKFGNVQGQTFEEAINLAQDLSTVFGTDLARNARQLGRVLQNPIEDINALSRFGIKFTEAKEEQIKALAAAGRLAEAQKLILKEFENISTAAEGAATATAAGALDTLGERFIEFLERLAIQSGALETVRKFAIALTGALEFLIDNIDGVAAAIDGFIAGLTTLVALKAVAWAGALAAGLLKAKTAMAALNVVMRANPIGLLITAVSALVALFVTFKNRTIELGGVNARIWDFVAEAMGRLGEIGKAVVTLIWEYFKELGDRIVNFWGGLWDLITATIDRDLSGMKAAAKRVGAAYSLSVSEGLIEAGGNLAKALEKNLDWESYKKAVEKRAKEAADAANKAQKDVSPAGNIGGELVDPFYSYGGLDKFTTALAGLMGKLAPATQRALKLKEAQKLLNDAAKLSAAQLRELGLTAKDLERAKSRLNEVFGEGARVINKELKAIRESVSLLRFSNDQREIEAKVLEVTNKAIQDGDPLRENEIRQLREALTLQQKLNKARSFADSYADTMMGLRQEIALAGVAGDKRERLSKIITMQNKAIEAGLDPAAVRKFTQEYTAMLDQLDAKTRAFQQDAMGGIMEGFRTWGREAQNLRDSLKDNVGSALDDLTDKLVDFTSTGKFEFSELARSASKMFAKTFIRNGLGSLAEKAGNMFGFGKGEGGILGQAAGIARDKTIQAQNAFINAANLGGQGGDLFGGLFGEGQQDPFKPTTDKITNGGEAMAQSLLQGSEQTSDGLGGLSKTLSKGAGGIGNALSSVMNALGGMFGGGSSGGGLFSSLAGIATSAFGGMFGGGGMSASLMSSGTMGGLGSAGTFAVLHKGGIVGDAVETTRRVSPSVFAGARRYHTGGVAGLKPNEVPIIAERGERILPKKFSARDVGGATYMGGDNGGGPAQINVSMNFPAQVSADFRRSQTQNAAQARRMLNAATRNL